MNTSTAYGDSLAFLLSQVGARSAALFAVALGPLGIAPRQFAVLSQVASGQPRTQQQLADLLGIHRNNMVALIDEMEAAGWVARHRGETDRRVFEIRPTDRGANLVSTVNQLIPELDSELTAALSDQQRDQLANALQVIADSLGLARAIHPHVASHAVSVATAMTRTAAPNRPRDHVPDDEVAGA